MILKDGENRRRRRRRLPCGGPRELLLALGWKFGAVFVSQGAGANLEVDFLPFS